MVVGAIKDPNVPLVVAMAWCAPLAAFAWWMVDEHYQKDRRP